MTEEVLYKKFAKYYDKVYFNKDYTKEVEIINWLVTKYKKSKGNKLLDVACGTGSHAALLKENFSVIGIDLNPEMLKLARKKVSGVKFIQGNMKTLDLKEKFDVITCLFTTMTYNKNYEELEKTLKIFYNHLYTGGLVIFDIGFHKDYWLGGSVWVDTYSDKDLQLARISQSPMEPKDGLFDGKMILLIKDKGKVDFEIDEHKLGVFEAEEIKKIMIKIGFSSFIYAGSTKKLWNKKMKGAVVFVGVKK
jgi:ubiquinone/menaquinone biosynthesis C-methylase UbiE